jgi:ketosteroid isomerase-like protein
MGNTDEGEVRSLIASWESSIRAGDLDAVLAHHADDVVMFDVAPPLRRSGLAGCRAAWEPFVHGGPHAHFELGELAVHAGTDVAFAHALLRLKPGAPYEVRITLGFAKRAGRWTLVHEHHSAPSGA